MSVYPMRAQLFVHDAVVTGPVKNLKVYGHIAGSTFWSNVVQIGTGCTGTVSNDVHTYEYFTAWGIGCWFTNDAVFATTNTCRELVLVMLSTDNSNGDPSSSGVSTVEMTQGTLNPQSVQFDDNQLETANFALDGTHAELQMSNTNGSAIYLIDSSYADCETSTGN